MRQHKTFQTKRKTHFLPFIFLFTCLMLSSCADNPLQPVSDEEAQRIKAELNDRSFRQFDPLKMLRKEKRLSSIFLAVSASGHNMLKVCMQLTSGKFQRTILGLRKQVRNTEFILKHHVPNKYSQPSATIASKPRASPFRFKILSIVRRFGSN